ncbi:hypothetical protein [Pseudenterobacter timonensis]|uniref:Uncharacterized protein n=1 Tax=Pseudenterobacter timonensis TaxID=1755099 RepID=A0ABV4AA49_9ENTR
MSVKPVAIQFIRREEVNLAAVLQKVSLIVREGDGLRVEYSLGEEGWERDKPVLEAKAPVRGCAV